MTNEELLELPCDILFVAAREDQLTGANAARVQDEAHRRGRERPDDARGGRDLRRARHSGRAGHPRERGRRHGLVLRVGAGPRPALLGSRRDPRPARRQDDRRVRPGLGRVGARRGSRCGRPRWSPRSARWPARSRRAESIRETSQTVRDAMVREPTALARHGERAGRGPLPRRQPRGARGVRRRGGRHGSSA